MVKGVSSTSWLSAAVEDFSTSVMVDVLFDSNAIDEIKLFMGKPNAKCDEKDSSPKSSATASLSWQAIRWRVILIPTVTNPTPIIIAEFR